MIRTQGLRKRFGAVGAVEGVSFDAHPGELLGLLGPNGAGKTTVIRMIMDILKPDAGLIEVLGGPVTDATKARIGYLPEERGLYRGYRLLECLTFLGALKGLSVRRARERSIALLERAGLAQYAGRKVRELSKGMAQKAQFLAAVVHDPEVLVLDEPFQGLDPVNTALLRGMLAEERARGRTIVLSTHDMGQVEEMCQRIVLVDHGRVVLYGPLADIKARHARHAVRLESDEPPPELAGVERVDERSNGYELTLQPGASAQDVLRQIVAAGMHVRRFEIATPPLEQIFVDAVRGPA